MMWLKRISPMSTTKILHVIARMNVGGTARYVGELVKNVPNSFLATGYIQGAELEDPIVSTLDTYRLPHLGRKISPINDVRAFLELRTLVRQLQPEIIHTHTFKAGLIGRLIGGSHKRVHTFHGHLFGDQSFSSLENRLITHTEIYLSKRTDLLISVGERVGAELRAAGIGVGKEWLSIPPGVTALPKLPKFEARTILDLDPHAFLVGWMARVTGVKNPLLMLDVARALPEVQFIMAGGGDLLDKVRESAPENVSILGWTDASTFWSAVDCALSTSDNEGMPIALIEAQLAGVPVVATDVGSNSEVITDGITGLIAKNDTKSLVAALGALMDNPTLLASTSEEAKRASLRNFSLSKMVSEHLNLYIHLSEKDR